MIGVEVGENYIDAMKGSLFRITLCLSYTIYAMDINKVVKDVSDEIELVFKDKAIKLFCLGNDSFMSLPTRYGKSMIYTVLPLVIDKVKGINL